MMRKSQAFAAFRQSLVTDGLDKVNLFVEKFNAEAEDIRQEFEKGRGYSEALAMDRKRARIADLIIRKNDFIKTLQSWFKVEQIQRLEEYEARLEESENKDGKKITVALFPDNTSARVSKSLWIDFSKFQRV